MLNNNKWMTGSIRASLKATSLHTRLVVFVIVCLLTILSGITASASLRAEPVIREIDIRNMGTGSSFDNLILTHTTSKAGNKLNRMAINKDIKAILKTDRFSSLIVEIEPLDDGVKLIYSYKNKLKLAEPVKITGARYLSESKIKKFLEIKQGDLIDDQVIGVGVQHVKKEYRKKHYLNTDITWQIDETDHTNGEAEVSILIKEGKQTVVKKTTISGNNNISTGLIRKVMGEPLWWNPFAWFKKRKYTSSELEAAQLRICDLYRSRGYLDIEVNVSGPEKDSNGDLIISANIEEGLVYKFGKVSLVGVVSFPKAEIEKLITTKRGNIASSQTIKTTIRAIKEYYGNSGYAYTTIKPVLDPDRSKGVVDIKFIITEGSQIQIRNIIIRGNKITRDKVIRRELLVYPGDLLNDIKVDISEKRISNLGYFSNVHSYLGNMRALDQKDLIFEVEEKRTGQFVIGAGFSSIDNLIGSIELSQGNFDINGWPSFTGGGQKLRLRGQFGSERKNYEISFTEPWFLDRKLSFGFDLYIKDYNYSDYNVSRSGGAINLAKALPGPNRISISYRLEDVTISNIADTNQYVFQDTGEEYFFNNEEDGSKSSIDILFTYDTRDNPFIPSRGNKIEISGSVSGGILGFDTDIYEGGIQTLHYIPIWFKHIIKIKAKYKFVESYGNTDDVPLSDLLFIGGGHTLRGFDYRDVGPKVIRSITTDSGADVSYHRPVGGKTFALVGVEYLVPITRGIRLAGFFDTGNVWADAFELNMNNYASSAGVGIRFDLPGFPIRFDRAWIINKDSELTGEDAWVFWIGYDY